MGSNRNHHNPRFLAIRTSEDAQRELNALGIGPGKGKVLGRESFNYYLKLGKVDPEMMRVFQDRVDALGGKVIISEEKFQKRENVDALIVGNLPFFKTLTSQTSGQPRKLQTLMQKLTWSYNV